MIVPPLRIPKCGMTVEKASDDSLDKYSILVFTETKSTFLSNKKARTNIGHQGGIHPFHQPEIIRMHLVYSSFGQLYLAKGLHRHPHFSIKANLKHEFISHLKSQCIDFVEYFRNRSYTTGDFLCVWNKGTPEFDELDDLFNDLALSHSSQFLFEPLSLDKTLNKRKNNQVSVGYSGMNQKSDSASGIHEAKPQKNDPNTQRFSTQFVGMSRIARRLKLECCEILDSETNAARQDAFAKAIHEENMWEGMTVGAYTDVVDKLLLIHVDDGNATQPGYDAQLVASSAFYDSASKTHKRVFVAVYGREACYHYMIRDRRSTILAKKLTELQEGCAIKHENWRLTIDRSLFAVTEGTVYDDLVIRKTHMDKGCLYSYATESILRYILRDSRPSPECEPNLFRTIELHYVFALVSAHDQFWVILKDWIDKPEDDNGGSLLLRYIECMRKKGGSGYGHCHRTQPYFNKSVSLSKLMLSLINLYTVVVDLNKAAETLTSPKKIQEAFNQALRAIMAGVHMAGGLTAQHILHPMILTGVIQGIPELGNLASIAKNTASCDRINRMFGTNMTAAQFANLLRTTADRLNLPQRVVEEMLCQLGKSDRERAKLVEPSFVEGNNFYSPKEIDGTLCIGILQPDAAEWKKHVAVVFSQSPPSHRKNEVPWPELAIAAIAREERKGVSNTYPKVVVSLRDQPCLKKLLEPFDQTIIEVTSSPITGRTKKSSVNARPAFPSERAVAVLRKDIPESLHIAPGPDRVVSEKIMKITPTRWSSQPPTKSHHSKMEKLFPGMLNEKFPGSDYSLAVIIPPCTAIPTMELTLTITGRQKRKRMSTVPVLISPTVRYSGNHQKRRKTARLGIPGDSLHSPRTRSCCLSVPSIRDMNYACLTNDTEVCVHIYLLANVESALLLRGGRCSRLPDTDKLCSHRRRGGRRNNSLTHSKFEYQERNPRGNKAGIWYYAYLSSHMPMHDVFGPTYRPTLQFATGGDRGVKDEGGGYVFKTKREAEQHLCLNMLITLAPAKFEAWIGDKPYVILRNPGSVASQLLCVLFRHNNDLWIGHSHDGLRSRSKIPC